MKALDTALWIVIWALASIALLWAFAVAALPLLVSVCQKILAWRIRGLITKHLNNKLRVTMTDEALLNEYESAVRDGTPLHISCIETKSNRG